MVQQSDYARNAFYRMKFCFIQNKFYSLPIISIKVKENIFQVPNAFYIHYRLIRLYSVDENEFPDLMFSAHD